MSIAENHGWRGFQPWPRAQRLCYGFLGQRHVAAQYVRVANRQLPRLEDYIVETADYVAATSQGSWQTGVHRSGPNNRTALAAHLASAQQENFGCTRISVRDVNSQGLGFLTLPEDLESSLHYGNARFTRQQSLATPVTHKVPGVCYGLCLSALQPVRPIAFQHSKPCPHPQASTVGIT